ncbi:MAG: hypothetical protein J3K34DRAFT_387951 [Monoraphidium minutum]|nr:MAG: hypothetical protein J3K34DRAFT_387951 [Monoraphidium minutum]
MGSEAPMATDGSHPRALPLDGSVVKMKGLPFKANVDDVLKFYSGFSLGSSAIYLKRHADGRLNGEAFVCFENPEEARRACQKDRETFSEKWGDRYVRVYPTLESDVTDMQQAVQQQNMVYTQGGHSHHSDSVVKMKSLPFDATQLDIIQFFEGFKLKANGVQLVVRSDNKPTGEAFVDFEAPDEAARALREKDHKVFHEKFGDRYVRLIQVSRKEMQATLSLRFGGEGILKVKGIPFKASPGDVRKFFSGYKIKADGVSFIMHQDGRPTGMAFIEFETPQEAVRAMDKDRAKFGPEYGDRFCMLQLVGRHEMDKVTLQREAEGGNKMMGGMNGVNAAAAMTMLQTLLSNPANLSMMMANSPWMAQHLLSMGGPPGQHQGHLGGNMPPATAAPPPGGMPPVDPGALAAAAQFGQQLGAGMGNIAGALNGLGLGALQHPPNQQGGGQAQGNHGPSGDVGPGWMPNAPPDNMVFYQNAAGNNGMERSWGDHR